MLYPEESYQIMAACFEVHNRMGCGFLEAVYQECLGIEFRHLGIPYVAQPNIQLHYRDQCLVQSFQPDFICFEHIVLELKAVENMHPRHESQLLNYLHATKYELGILINFGAQPKLEYKRLALSNPSNR